jgi:hypothetical protein
MAGGFGGRGAPLYARTRAGPAPREAAAEGTTPPTGGRLHELDEPDGPAGCPARHCWVTAPVDGGVPRPGLLLEWRRGEHGWEGRVAYAAELRAERWGAVEEWLPAEVVASVERTTPPHPQQRVTEGPRAPA